MAPKNTNIHILWLPLFSLSACACCDITVLLLRHELTPVTHVANKGCTTRPDKIIRRKGGATRVARYLISVTGNLVCKTREFTSWYTASTFSFWLFWAWLNINYRKCRQIKDSLFEKFFSSILININFCLKKSLDLRS